MECLKKLLKTESYRKEVLTEARWMFGYIRRYKLFLLMYILFGVAGTLAGLAGGVASKYLIDAVMGDTTHDIAEIVVILVCMALGNIAANAVTGRISAQVVILVQNEVRAEIYEKIIYTDWETIQGHGSGDLLNRLNKDVGILSNGIINWIPEFVTRTVQFLMTFSIIVYYDATMAVIALLGAPISLVVSRILVWRMRKYNKEMNELGSEMMSFQNDSFQNLQTLKAFNLMGTFTAKMKNLQGIYKEKALNYNKFSIYTTAFMSVVGMVVSDACFGWGVYRLWTGGITYGTMVLFLQMASSLTSSFSGLVHLVPAAIRILTSAGRVKEVAELDKEEVLDEEMRDFIRRQKENGLTVEANGTKMIYQNGKTVFSEADFIAEPGEIIAVIGPSGEGKTTFVRLLLGLLKPAEGRVTIASDEAHKCRVSSGTREFFSYVPQGNTIFAGTIAENLRLVKPDATEGEIKEALKISCAYDFVMKHPDGIYQTIKENGIGLSEGQAQRIAIARAVLRDAPVFLMDEVTSALDMELEEKVLLNLLKNRENKTYIITTHRPSVLSMCGHIYEVKGNSLEK